MKQTVPFLLSMTLLLASCAPTTVQTASGPQTLTVISGAGLALSNGVPFEAMTPQTPDDAAITFSACPGGAVHAADVRTFGKEVAVQACQQAIRQAVEIQTGAMLVMAPISLLVGYFFYRLTLCPLTFGTGPGCKAG